LPEVILRLFPSDYSQPEALIQFLSDLSLIAAREADKLPPTVNVKRRAGQPAKGDLVQLVRVWLAVYRKAGGMDENVWWDKDKKRYRGKFLELLEVAFQQVQAQLCDTTELRHPLPPRKRYKTLGRFTLAHRTTGTGARLPSASPALSVRDVRSCHLDG
jgi:hypothetical protein